MEDLYSKDYETLNSMIGLMLKSDRENFTYKFFKDSDEFKGFHVDVLKQLLIELKDDYVVGGTKRLTPDSKEWIIRPTGITEKFFMDGGYKDVNVKQHQAQHRTTNVHAENVQYNEGSNYGGQSQSSSRTTNKAAKNEMSVIKKVLIGVAISVIGGLLLYYAFGIGG